MLLGGGDVLPAASPSPRTVCHGTYSRDGQRDPVGPLTGKRLGAQETDSTQVSRGDVRRAAAAAELGGGLCVCV